MHHIGATAVSCERRPKPPAPPGEVASELRRRDAWAHDRLGSCLQTKGLKASLPDACTAQCRELTEKPATVQLPVPCRHVRETLNIRRGRRTSQSPPPLLHLRRQPPSFFGSTSLTDIATPNSRCPDVHFARSISRNQWNRAVRRRFSWWLRFGDHQCSVAMHQCGFCFSMCPPPTHTHCFQLWPVPGFCNVNWRLSMMRRRMTTELAQFTSI